MTLGRIVHLLVFAGAAVAALVLGAIVIETARVLAGHCDEKLGCVGGVWFVVLFASVAASVSSCALLTVTYIRAEVMSGMASRVLAVIGVIEGFALAALLRTVGFWPFELIVSAVVWAVVSAALGLVLVSLAGLKRRVRFQV